MRTPPVWQILALLLVLAAHLWLGWALANYRPDGKLFPVHAREQPRPHEVLLVLEFPTLFAPARTRAPQARRPLRHPPSAVVQETAAASDAGAATAMVAIDAGRPLDLRPAPLPKAKFARTGPLNRAPALTYESTRYDAAWISTGNLTEVVARRSVVAGALLGALGALRKTCTEKDRANYEVDCVPAQYEYKPSTE